MKNNKINKFLIPSLLFVLLVFGCEKYSRGEERDFSLSFCKKIANVKIPYDLHWSPDGSEICFYDGKIFPCKNLYFIKTDTGEIRKTEPLLFLQNIDPKNRVSILATYWSPNGREIALWVAGQLNGKSPNKKILIIDSKNSTNSRIYPEIGQGSIILDSMNNCWSPDGGKILLMSGLGRGEYELSVMDSKTLKPIQKHKVAPISGPAWSSDGKEIYFIGKGTDDKSLFCSIKLGQNERKIISDLDYTDTEVRCYKVSPNYARIAWVGTDEHSLWAANIDGSDKKRVFSSKDGEIGGTAFFPILGNQCLSWSPDGKKIIFSLFFFDYSGSIPQLIDSSIWMVNFDGTSLFQLSPPNAHFCTNPKWSPDGEKIAFIAYFSEDKPKNTANANLTNKDLLKLGETALNYNYSICITKQN